MTQRRIRPLPPARIARLEAERITRQAETARKRSKHNHFLYFFVCEGHVKIGYARDPVQRCRAAQVGNPFPVVLAGLTIGGKREERILHRAFRHLHVRAEWFRLEGPLAEIVSKIGELNEPQSARLWLGEWLASFNGSMAMFPSERTHKNGHMDVRIEKGQEPNDPTTQIDRTEGNVAASGL